MKHLNIIITAFILIGISTLKANDVQKIYKDLNELSALSEKVAVVDDFSFSRDVANFHLQSGKLYLLSQVNEKTIAAVFKGKGTVSITPPTKISRERLYSEFQTESYNNSFDLLFLVFTDSTLAEFSNKLDFTHETILHKFQTNIDPCIKYLYDTRDNAYNTSLIRAILNNEQGGYFYAHLSKGIIKRDNFFFEIDPNQTEEVTLSVRYDRGTHLDHYHKSICKFHRTEDYLSNSDLSFEKKDEIYVDKYIIDANITNRMEFSATCSIEFHGLKNSSKWLNLFLFDKLRINSITSLNGDLLNFYKGEEGNILWIELPETITKDHSYKILIDYYGDLIYRGGNIVKIYSYDYWYPQYLSYDYNFFDLTFHYPSSYDLVSVGKKISEVKHKKVKTAHWFTKYPVNFAPFNMGKFKNEEFKNPAIPSLSLHLNKNLKKAKADVANSLAFYQSIYGKCNFDTLTVVEIPRFLSGEAYPGLINFYADDFITKAHYKVYSDIYVDETNFAHLRAHEVAHQWWGCGVGIRNYHDFWLFEGLAEFSSFWFIQTSLNDTKKYFELLSKWQAKITNEHSNNQRKKKTDCPLWLGSRAPSYLIYGKGAWVFHMLRNLMIDIKTFDESKFKAMMKDYYITYNNSTATTEDFKLIVEKHMKTDMNWFFDQWIYGNEIPKFKFDYDIVKKDDGKYYANCTIEQKNVSESFISYIPIEFDFGNNQKARIRTMVKGSESTFEIPLPQKPKQIHFNIFNSVLCLD